MDLEEYTEILKEIFITTSKLGDKFTRVELEKYPRFRELINELNSINIQWRYYFLIDDKDLVFSLNGSLHDLEEYEDSSSLLEVERISNDVLNEIDRLKNNKKIAIDKEFTDKEIVINHELKFINRSITADAKLNELKEKLDNLQTKLEKVLQDHSLVEEGYKEGKRIINDLKNKNNIYNQIVDEDSNSRIQKLYLSIHEEEILIANKYRNWALYIFCGVGFLILVCFFNISIQNWNNLRDSSYIEIPFGKENVLRILMLFSLTTPAWYLTRESSKHRKVAYKAKMLGTELASFPLYAREFKDEDRLELRKQLADRFFGQELYSDVTNSASSDNSLEQIKLLTEANKALTESLKIKKATE